MLKNSQIKVDDSIFYYLVHGYIGHLNANTRYTDA